MPAQLAIRRVSVSLAGRSVLSSVSFAVGPDARIGLLGRNGVGKTTLLRVLAGAVPPDAGRVIRAPEDLHVGYPSRSHWRAADRRSASSSNAGPASRPRWHKPR